MGQGCRFILWKVLLRYHHFPFLGLLSLRWIRKCTKNLCGAKTTSLSDISFLFHYRADQNLGHIESGQPVPYFSLSLSLSFQFLVYFLSMIVQKKIEVTCVPADSLRRPTWVCWPVTTFLSFKFKLFNTKRTLSATSNLCWGGNKKGPRVIYAEDWMDPSLWFVYIIVWSGLVWSGLADLIWSGLVAEVKFVLIFVGLK